MNCGTTGCKAFATHFPEVCVPGMGTDPKRHAPMGCVISIPLCASHARAFDVQAWLKMPTPQGGMTMRDAFAALATGRAEPDFERTFVKIVPFRSRKAKQFRAMLANQAAMPQVDANQPVSTTH